MLQKTKPFQLALVIIGALNNTPVYAENNPLKNILEKVVKETVNKVGNNTDGNESSNESGRSVGGRDQVQRNNDRLKQMSEKRKQGGKKEPEFPEGIGIYEGPARFDRGFHTMFKKNNQESYSLSKQEFYTVRVTNSYNDPLVPYIRCVYSDPSDKDLFESTSLWYKHRPVITLKENDIKALAQNRVYIDKSLENCPATWGEMVNFAWGEGALQAYRTNEKLREDQLNKQVLESERLRAIEDTKWAEGNLVANSRAKDIEYTQKIDAILKDMWSRRSSMSYESFKQEVKDNIDPLMVPLARSGLAQFNKIPSGEKGRKSFEAWDNGVGFTVIYLNWILQNKFDEKAVYNTESGRIWRYYLDLYTQQIKDKGTLEQKYMSKILADAEKYKNAGYDGIAPTIEKLRTDSRITTNGDESLLYRSISDGVNAYAGIMEARAKIKKYIEDSNVLLEKTRKDFWSCYEARCSDAAIRWIDYSKMLLAKDQINASEKWNEITINKLSEGMKSSEGTGALYNKFFNMDKRIDGGPIYGCSDDWDSFIGKIIYDVNSNKDGLNMIFSNPQNYAKSFSSPEFMKYQTCRDRMEYVLRDRKHNGYVN